MRSSHYDWVGSGYFVGKNKKDITEFGTFMATVDQPRYYPAVHNQKKHTSPKGYGIVYIRFTKRVKSDGTSFWYIEEVQSNNDASKVELIKQKIELKETIEKLLDNKDLFKVAAENISSVLNADPEVKSLLKKREGFNPGDPEFDTIQDVLDSIRDAAFADAKLTPPTKRARLQAPPPPLKKGWFGDTINPVPSATPSSSAVPFSQLPK
jgi:hypothetical protein